MRVMTMTVMMISVTITLSGDKVSLIRQRMAEKVKGKCLTPIIFKTILHSAFCTIRILLPLARVIMEPVFSFPREINSSAPCVSGICLRH